MKQKSLNIFVRYGGLDLKNQKGYSKNVECFHQPPAPRGFYAMPKIAQESFLIGCLDKTQPDIFPKKPKFTEGGNYDEYRILCAEYEERCKKIYSNIFKEFKLSNDANIWHHLNDNVKPSEIIKRNGYWIKTSVKVWKKAFSKKSVQSRIESGQGDINSTFKISGYYSKDHLEIFVDEK
jgi:hypothetical protein